MTVTAAIWHRDAPCSWSTLLKTVHGGLLIRQPLFYDQLGGMSVPWSGCLDYIKALLGLGRGRRCQAERMAGRLDEYPPPVRGWLHRRERGAQPFPLGHTAVSRSLDSQIQMDLAGYAGFGPR